MTRQAPVRTEPHPTFLRGLAYDVASYKDGPPIGLGIHEESHHRRTEAAKTRSRKELLLDVPSTHLQKMKPNSIRLLMAAIFALTIPLRAETEQPTPTATASPVAIASPSVTASPAATKAPGAYEPIPTLNASEILQPQYFQGPNFKVRDSVPTYSGSNHYTIDSDFGVFEADGNQMLMRRVAEINAIAQLESISQTKEFTQAAEKAAKVPLQVARDLINNPVSTLSSVPRGIWGFLNQAGQAVKEATEGRESTPAEGNAVANLTGFSKTKRDLAIKLGVDPYSTNEVFQKELNKVAWPAFLGKFTVSLGMDAVSGGAGAALTAANWTNTLTEALRDKSPTELRLMNLELLTNNMGIDRAVAVAFLNNNAISPSTQTLLVSALAQLGNIPGQADFIVQATTSQDEHDAIAFQQSVQIMADLNKSTPVVRITRLNGLTVCQTKDGTVVVPIQWDYAVWTPMTEQFITALKDRKFTPPATGYSVILTGVVSPMTAQALAGRGVNVTTRALPGPLQ
jgi:hypothetical protein